VTTLAQIEANRRNSLLSTGPRTASGKARSAVNATKHGFTGRLAVAIPRGPFEEDADQIQEFITQVVRELAPVGLQERAEATQIAALYVRRHRLLELEAEALACATRISTAEMLADLDDPFAAIADEPGTERSAVRALRRCRPSARGAARVGHCRLVQVGWPGCAEVGEGAGATEAKNTRNAVISTTAATCRIAGALK